MKPREQSGLSLISMLVGLILGGIAITTTAALFKVGVLQSIDSRVAAKQDTQIALALVSLQQDISKAGFGIASSMNSCLGSGSPGPAGTANTDFILVQDPRIAINSDGSMSLSGIQKTISSTSGSNANGQAIIWHWNDGTADRCAGLVGISGGLKRLVPNLCADANQWTTVSWSAQDLIAPGSFGGNTGINFAAAKAASCTPYGTNSNGPGLLVTVVAGNSGGALSTSETFCVPNVCK